MHCTTNSFLSQLSETVDNPEYAQCPTDSLPKPPEKIIVVPCGLRAMMTRVELPGGFKTLSICEIKLYGNRIGEIS